MNITRSQAQIALGILGAVVAALLLNRLIVTDKRRVERTIQQMADAAAKGDVDLLFSHVSEDYRDDNMSRADLKSLVTSFLGAYEHVDPRIQQMTVNVSGALARVELTVSGNAESKQSHMPLGTSDWAAEFRKEADGAWRATSIVPVRLWGRPISGWRELPHDFY